MDIVEVHPRFRGSPLGSPHAGVTFPQLAALAALLLSFPDPGPHLVEMFDRCRTCVRRSIAAS